MPGAHQGVAQIGLFRPHRFGRRTPFVVEGDWTRIDAAALSASLMRAAVSIAGRGAVTRIEVISQAPRRRTGVVAR